MPAFTGSSVRDRNIEHQCECTPLYVSSGHYGDCGGTEYEDDDYDYDDDDDDDDKKEKKNCT